MREYDRTPSPSEALAWLSNLSVKLPAVILCFAFFGGSAAVIGQVIFLPVMWHAVTAADILGRAVLITPALVIAGFGVLYFYHADGVSFPRTARFLSTHHSILYHSTAVVLIALAITAVYYENYILVRWLSLSGSVVGFATIFQSKGVYRSGFIPAVFISPSVSFFLFIAIFCSSARWELLRLPVEDFRERSYTICVATECREGVILTSLSQLTAIRWVDKLEINYVRTSDVARISVPLDQKHP